MAAVLPREHRGERIRVRKALMNSLSSSFSSSSSQPALFTLPECCKQVEMLSACAIPLVLLAHLFLHAPSLYCFSKACNAEEVKPHIKHQVTCEPHRGADFNPVFRRSVLDYFIFFLKRYLLSPTATPCIHHASAFLCFFTFFTCLFSVLKSLPSSLSPGLEESPGLLIILAFVFSPSPHKGPLHFLNVYPAWNISHKVVH